VPGALGAVVREMMMSLGLAAESQNGPIIPFPFSPISFTVHLIRRCGHLCSPTDHTLPRSSNALPPLFSAPVATLSDLARLRWASLASTLAAYTTPGVHLLATSFQLAGYILVSSLE
jgi:hypothetical protein